MADLHRGVLRPNGSLTTIEYTVCLAEGAQESSIEAMRCFEPPTKS